ncbi:hypothetical protein ABZW30_44480 [Kitasatospora sp. NPDC004669]|uniref:hypothetical protein n=1 Tax=Kitasatospora sp. NPDC004669 TaxID=3154555 RepID=UPI0033B36162
MVDRTLVVPTGGATGLYAIDTGTGRIRRSFRNGSNSLDDWLLAGDGERIIAQRGASALALPPAGGVAERRFPGSPLEIGTRSRHMPVRRAGQSGTVARWGN